MRADPGLFHPHLGLRLRIRSEPRAEQLRCMSFSPRRFPHAERKPPQRLHTNLTQAQRREEQRKVNCQRDMARQESVAFAAVKEPLVVVHYPSWLTRSRLPTLLGSVVNTLGPRLCFLDVHGRDLLLSGAGHWKRRTVTEGEQTCFRFPLRHSG